MCNGCSLTDRGCPKSDEYGETKCWAMTPLMTKGGELLTANKAEMERSSARIRTRLQTDGPGEYSGPPPTTFEECSNIQKRLICYYKIFRFLYGVGHAGVRIALPSCCVLRIQNCYPDPQHPPTFEEGFIDASFQDGLFNPSL